MVNFSLSTVTTTAFLIAFSPSAAVLAAYSCTFSEPMTLDSDGQVVLSQYVNEEEGTFTMKVIYNGGQSYIGIGVNQEGLPAMNPGIAVIGRNDNNNVSVVDKYMMTALNGVQVMDDSNNGGIISSTFEQTETTSTLTFTQLLSEENQVAITDDTQWLYAIGFDDNGWGGHSIRGTFQLSLSRSCTLTDSEGTDTDTGEEEEDATPSPTKSSSAVGPTLTRLGTATLLFMCVSTFGI